MKKIRLNLKPIIVCLAVFVLPSIGFIGFRAFKDGSHKATTSDGQLVNLEPPTEQEEKETDKHKEDLASKPMGNNNSINNDRPPQISVIITDANATTVRGYVNGVFEENGTCTATAEKDTQTITKSSKGFQNVSYTQCSPIRWDKALESGEWNITLSYSSASGEGNQVKSVEVQ